MKLYTKEGWLDTKHVEEVADKNNINFIIIIGKRQIGKTYNVLTLMLDENKNFIFMRRVKPELEMLEKGVNSPFDKLKKYQGFVTLQKESEYTAKIVMRKVDDDGNENLKQIGLGAALSTIGRLRGFNGDLYSDVVFDEFIPEEHLYKVRNEGTAFKSAHDTINGNRELEGRRCLRWWLLANSNDLDNAILEALHITKIVERMSIRGDEYMILKDRGIMIIMPDSPQISEKRAKTGLYRAIGLDDDYSKMALGNEFSFNDYTDVQSCALQEFNPYLTIGNITICLHKSQKYLYVVDKLKAKPKYKYTDSKTHINTFNRKHSDVKAAYLNGRMVFNNMSVKNYFLHYAGLD